MKTSGLLAGGVMAVALVLQGCVATGETRPDQAAQATSAPASAQPVPAASGTLIAQESGKPVVKADSKENLEAVMAAIHQQMQPGGRWQYINNDERATIDDSFADMGKLYDRFGSVDKMNQQAKVRLLADQNTVNAILTKKDGDRLICQSVRPVGSHLPVKTCKTYAQTQAEQNGAQEYLRRHEATQQNWSGH